MNSFNAEGFAGVVVTGDEASIGLKSVVSDMKSIWKKGFVSSDHILMIASDDGVMRPAKARIGEISGASGKDLVVGRLNVGMSADDSRDFSIEESAKGDLLRGGFGVEINEDTRGFFSDFIDFKFHAEKGVLDFVSEEGSALSVHDPYFFAVTGDDNRSFAIGSGGIVDRANQAWLLSEEGEYIAIIPRMIPESDDIDSGAHEIDGDFWGNSTTAGRVFTVDDDEIGAVFLLNDRN